MADTRVAAMTLCFDKRTMSRRWHPGLCSSDQGQEDIHGRQSALPPTQSQEGQGRQGKAAWTWTCAGYSTVQGFSKHSWYLLVCQPLRGRLVSGSRAGDVF